MRISSFTTSALGWLAFGPLLTVYGHSWIDNITVTGGTETPNGVLGYIRNYQGHVDRAETYRITQDPSEGAAGNGMDSPACAPDQSTPKNTPQFPRLTAAPGTVVMGQWLENGHISLPLTNTSKSGEVYWYGTSHPKENATLGEVTSWTRNGKGGDGTGVLLNTDPFDDGICVEPNQSPTAKERLAAGGGGACKGTFTVPEDAKDGSTYTVYWVWNYSGKNGAMDPKHFEWYTSCMDINVRKPGTNGTATNGDDAGDSGDSGDSSSSDSSSTTSTGSSATPTPTTTTPVAASESSSAPAAASTTESAAAASESSSVPAAASTTESTESVEDVSPERSVTTEAFRTLSAKFRRAIF